MSARFAIVFCLLAGASEAAGHESANVHGTPGVAKIYVDAGYGADAGARPSRPREQDLTRRIAQALVEKLEEAGYTAVLVGDGEQEISAEHARIAKAGTDLLVVLRASRTEEKTAILEFNPDSAYGTIHRQIHGANVSGVERMLDEMLTQELANFSYMLARSMAETAGAGILQLDEPRSGEEGAYDLLAEARVPAVLVRLPMDASVPETASGLSRGIDAYAKAIDPARREADVPERKTFWWTTPAPE